MRVHLLILAFLVATFQLSAQSVIVNGYVFETGNRGYLNQVDVNIVNKATGQSMKSISTNNEGYFELELPENEVFVAYAKKQLFEKQELEFDTKDLKDGKKFLKIQMKREPGYDFEVTLAPKRESEDIPVDAIRGAWVEVYNNTTKKEILNLKNLQDLEFNVHFDKGNHYTLMIRKEGFFTKRMEAYVNVDGCILCFEGVGSIRPGVVENLTEGNEMGVLLTNVELDPLFSGKTFEVQNIYYDLGKATLRSESKVALKNLATVLKDNPHINVELGSHTDSRGTDQSNQVLSNSRAKSAVDYLVDKCDVSQRSIIAAGYGETLLTNDCGNGARCSEEEHQKNRRTEIKVLNINDEKRQRKTLQEIRVEEEFMKSIMNNEVETKIVKPSDSDSQKVNSSQNPKSTEDKGSQQIKSQDTKSNTEKSSLLKESNKKVNKNNEYNSTVKGQKTKEAGTLEKNVVITNQNMASNTTVISGEENEAAAAAAAAAAAEKEEKEEKLAIEKTLAENDRKEEAMRQAKEAELVKKAAKEAENLKIKEQQEERLRLENIEKTKQLKTAEESQIAGKDEPLQIKDSKTTYNTLANYTGYKVVIQFSRYPLPDDHEIFTRHTDIEAYNATSGSILYLIGDFTSEEKANAFLEKTVLLMYPGAYVISFKNGQRLK